MASFDVVDLDRLEPGERDRLRQESARWDRIGADRQRQDAANAEIGRRLTSRAFRPWKSVRDVAVIAMGQDFNVDDAVIEAELGEIFEAARLGLLSRDGRIGIVVAVHGMRPVRLTQQYIADQSYWVSALELSDRITPAKARAQVAALFLGSAWMTDWAAAAYTQIAERRRLGGEDTEPVVGWDMREQGKPPQQVAVVRMAKKLWPEGKPHNLLCGQVNDILQKHLSEAGKAPSPKTIDRALGRKRKAS